MLTLCAILAFANVVITSIGRVSLVASRAPSAVEEPTTIGWGLFIVSEQSKMKAAAILGPCGFEI